MKKYLALLLILVWGFPLKGTNVPLNYNSTNGAVNPAPPGLNYNLPSGTQINGNTVAVTASAQPSDLPLLAGNGLLTSFIDSTLGPAQGNIAACGDSLTAADGVGGTFPGWPYVVQNLPFARNMMVFNFGASGQITSYGVTNYSTNTGVGLWQNGYLNVSKSSNPHAVSLLTGPNFLLDFWGYNDLQQIAGGLSSKTTTATLNGTTTVSALSTATNLTVGCYIVSTATDTITTDGTNVSNGDTVTLGSTVYRFETTPVQINDITIGSSAANSLAALENALNGNAGRVALGTYFFPGTNPNPVAFGSNITSTILTLSSRAQGSGANSIACSTTAAHLTVAHATLIGSHFPENTTVVSVNTGASTAVLSNGAIDSASGVTLTCGIETLAGWETSEQSFLALAQADSYHGHVVRMEIGPTYNNTVLYQTLLAQMNSFIDSNVNGTNGADFVMKVNGLPGLNPPTPYNEADNIHWNATGNYAIGNFVDWQLRQDFTSFLTGFQNIFAPGAQPDSYIPTTIPRLKQSNLFQPYLYPGLVTTTGSWTASSNTVVITGSMTNIQLGMSIRSTGALTAFGEFDAFQQGVVITNINSNTLTLSGNSSYTGTGTFYAQAGTQPLANVINGDLFVGPGTNAGTGANDNWIHLTSVFGGSDGITTDGTGWVMTFPGSTTGDAYWGNSSQNFHVSGTTGGITISLNSGTSTFTVSGPLVSTGTASAINFTATGSGLSHNTRAYQYTANTPSNDIQGAANFRGQLNGTEEFLAGYFCANNTSDAGAGAAGNYAVKLDSGVNYVITDGTNVLLSITRTSPVLALPVIGETISLKGGSNAASGTVTLVAGTGTVTSTAITTSSVVWATLKTPGGTETFPPLITVSTGTAVFSANTLDSGTYNWGIVQVNQ